MDRLRRKQRMGPSQCPSGVATSHICFVFSPRKDLSIWSEQQRVSGCMKERTVAFSFVGSPKVEVDVGRRETIPIAQRSKEGAGMRARVLRELVLLFGRLDRQTRGSAWNQDVVRSLLEQVQRRLPHVDRNAPATLHEGRAFSSID